jgi:putative methyltransferase (TIGR04325 family)
MSVRLQQTIDSVLSLPGLREARAARFERAFAAGHFSGVCRGVYRSFADATAAAPQTRAVGYDHDAAGALYHERLDRVYPGDYPMLFWLEQAFNAGATRVFDLGGHVGISYYAYEGYLRYPAALQWRVLDTPAVAKAGREIAAKRDTRKALSFVDDMTDAASADVLFTAGCLQYLEDSLAQRLSSLSTRPPIVLINLVPMHGQHDYWTVQSIDTAFCAYHVQRTRDFFAAMSGLGYELIDQWENAEKRCIVQFEPEHSFTGYVGATFQLPGARVQLPRKSAKR